MNHKINRTSTWKIIPDPYYIYNNMRFKAVALQPPDFNPGSWVGAGKIILDKKNHRFILTARPRVAKEGARGYAANIYESSDGEKFNLLISLTKEEINKLSSLNIHSIEGTQLLLDPVTNKWHFYVSVDTGSEFIWGGVFWETLLLVCDDLKGPWESKGLVIKHDQPYDACQARDGSIDIIDRKWMCLYRAHDKHRNIRMALATSSNGIKWTKQGPLTVDEKHIQPLAVSGTIFPSKPTPIFLGITMNIDNLPTKEEEQIFYDKGKVPHGMRKFDFTAYKLQIKTNNLSTIFRAPWVARSPFEHKEYPVFGYSSHIFDPFQERLLIYITAIDPKTKKMGLNETIERVLVYACDTTKRN